MAKSATNKLKPIVTGIIIVLLTVGLSLFMITDAFSPRSANAAALVGKADVSLSQFKRSFDNNLLSYNRENGTRLTGPQAYDQGFADQILGSMITQEAWKVDADLLGVGVSNQVMVDELSQYQIFKDEFTGRFDESKLNQYLANQRQSRAEFERTLSTSLATEQTQSAIRSAVQAPTAFALQRYNYLTEQRKVSSLTLNRSALPDLPEPDDDTLKTFIADNQANYIAPEFRRFTLIRLEKSDFFPDITIEEDEVKSLYEDKLAAGLLGTPELRSLVLLNSTNETLANDAIERLKSGQTPEQVTQALGLVEPTFYDDAEQDAIIDSRAAQAAFAAADGDIIAVEGALSWYVAQVTSITPPEVASYEELREELAAEAKSDSAEQQIYDVSADVEDAIGEGASLDEAAKRAGASLVTIDYVSRLGDTQDNMAMAGFESLAGIAGDDNILTELFTNDIDYETDFFETSTGGYAILRVDDIINSAPYPFEDVRAQARGSYLAQEYDTQLSDLARDLTQRVRDGESLDDISNELGQGGNVEELVMLRSSRNETVGPQVMVQIFEARSGDVVQGDGPISLTRNIAVLNDIVPNQDGLVGGYADAMRTQVKTALEEDLLTAYRAAILEEHPVQVFDDKIRATLGVPQ